MQPCKFFLQSRCTKGTSCPFRHDTATTAAPSGQRNIRVAGVPKRTPCRFFASGECSRGNGCAFSHDLVESRQVTQEAAPLENPSSPAQDSRAQLVCKFYLRGGCNHGHQCPYKHEGDGGAEKTNPEDSIVSWMGEFQDSSLLTLRLIPGRQ